MHRPGYIKVYIIFIDMEIMALYIACLCVILTDQFALKKVCNSFLFN